MKQQTNPQESEKIWRIINPSDSYTIASKSFAAAAVATLVIGEGKYALDPVEEGGDSMPLLVFGGDEAWVKEKFNMTLEDLLNNTPMEDVIAAMKSVEIGDETQRGSMETADNPMEYHDAMRSSMNDIGRAFWDFAKMLDEELINKAKKEEASRRPHGRLPEPIEIQGGKVVERKKK